MMWNSLVTRLVLSLGCVSLIQAPSIAQDASRPPPANTAPGIVEFQSSEKGPVLVNRELDEASVFQVITDLPLAAIKGQRKAGSTNKIGCNPATVPLACLVDVTIDAKREIWLHRAGRATGEKTGEATLVRLPDQVVDSVFWNSPLVSLVGNGPLTFATIPEGQEVPAKAWVENRSAQSPGEGSTWHTYDLPANNQLLITRASFNGEALSGLFLILSPTFERYATPSQGFEILAASADGTFTTYAVPPQCEVLGAISDVIICGANPRGYSSASLSPPYPKVLRLRLPEGTKEDITRNYQAPAFQPVGDAILIRGMVNGVARPFIQGLEGSAAPALSGEEICILPHEHVDVFDVTASRKAALMRVVSPLRPTRLILAPIEAERIQICAPSAQLYRDEPAEALDHAPFRVQRAFANVPDTVPYTLISGPTQGPLQGHLLAITYPHAAIWLPEGYLGPWLTHWVSQGGQIAFTHLPGGGGYGAAWSSKGFGIRNKINVSRLFDEVTQDFVEQGLAEEGKIAVLTESGGGPVMARAILRSPARYSVLALRAACLAIEGEQREACAAAYDYGNWFDEEDRALMDEFEPLDRVLSEPEFPAIVYGRPEFDNVLDLAYQDRMIERLKPKEPDVIAIPGVNHTDRATAAQEAAWVKAISGAATNARAMPN